MNIETGFTLDGIHSDDMDVWAADLESGFKEFPFGVKQNILEEKIGDKFLLNKVEKDALSFTINIATKQGAFWDYEKRKSVVQWVFKKDYIPLVFDDNPNIVYYVIAISDNKRFVNSLEEGYATVAFRCDAPYGWSYPVNISTYDLSANTTSKIIEINNVSNIDEYYYPEIEFKNLDTTPIKIKNLSDGGRELIFSNLDMNETVYTNNIGRVITDKPNTYRLGDCNKKWLRLVNGVNRLEITGKCEIEFRCQYPIAL